MLKSFQQQKKNLPIEIESATEGEFLSINETEKGVLVLRGKVILKLSKGKLRANLITIDNKKKTIYAEGNIIYTEGKLKITGNNFIYNLKLERGVIYKIKGSYYPAYFFGEKFKKIDHENYLLEIVYFTNCNAEKPHFSFKAKKIVFQQDKNIAIFNARLYVGAFPVLPIPFLYLSSLGNGWKVQAGSNNTQGNFFQNSYRWSVPGFSFLFPINYLLRLDWYEKTGEVLQLDMIKISPWLNYNVKLGYADHKKYRFTNSFEERLGTSFGLGNVVVTNQIHTDPLSEIPTKYKESFPFYRNVGIQREDWQKANVLLNARKSSNKKNYTRNFFIKYDYYSNRFFEYEYGNRYNSKNTFYSFYTEDDTRLPLVLNSLNWSIDYIEQRNNWTLEMEIDKNFSYYDLQPTKESNFFPVNATLPKLNITSSTPFAQLPYSNSPLYYDFTFYIENQKYYSTTLKKQTFEIDDKTIVNPNSNYKAEPVRDEIFSYIENGLKTTVHFGSYISLTPSLYYGAQKYFLNYEKNTVSNSDISQKNTLKQKSYQYIRGENNLRIGTAEIFFNVKHNQKNTFQNELEDPTGNVPQNELELSLESYLMDDWYFALLSNKDIRKNPKEINDKEKWYFTIFRSSGFFDFLNHFRKKRISLLEKKRSLYSGIYINNDFVYKTFASKPHSNILDISYKMGGFSVPLIQTIKEFDIGFNWYHVYDSPELDRYGFFFKTDTQVSRNIEMEFEIDSAVADNWKFAKKANIFENYLSQEKNSDGTVYFNLRDFYNSTTNQENSQSTNIFQDILEGMGFYGPEAKKKTAFNIKKLLVGLKYNLHLWDFKVGYSMGIRAIPSGLKAEQQLNFYDQSVYFSASMSKFSFGKTPTKTKSKGSRIYHRTKKYFDNFVWEDWIE